MKTVNGWVQLGEVAEILSKFGRLPIGDYHQRIEFMNRHRASAIVSIYNDGAHAYIDTLGQPIDSFCVEPWLWMKFRDYYQPKMIPLRSYLNQNIMSPNGSDYAAIMHHGHSAGVVTMTIGRVKEELSFEKARTVRIPPQCVQFVAIYRRRVVDTMLLFQPLPKRLLPSW